MILSSPSYCHLLQSLDGRLMCIMKCQALSSTGSPCPVQHQYNGTHKVSVCWNISLEKRKVSLWHRDTELSPLKRV